MCDDHHIESTQFTIFPGDNRKNNPYIIVIHSDIRFNSPRTL
jgi:hypothetical protein